jgi:hypothetical protein
VEEVVAAQSIMIRDLLEAYHLAGKAINRLEAYTFSLVKVALDNELVPYEKLVEDCSNLMQSENLEDFWGVSPEKEKGDSSQQELPIDLD